MEAIDIAVVAALDFHDARLEDVCISPSGRLVIRFSSINVYERVPGVADRFEVRGYEAALEADGVTSLHCVGSWSVDSYADGLTVDGRPPDDRPGLELGADWELHEFHLKIIAGASIRWTGGRARVRLVSRGEYIETWEGPL